MANLKTYKARWEDFRIECANLDYARRACVHGYANESLDGDEAYERMCRFEDRHAHEPVWRRASLLMDQYYARANI